MPEDFTITLEPLTAGKFGLTKVCGSFLAEAAAFCLYQHKHAAPVVFTVRGDVAKSGFLVWDVATEQHRGSYADLPEATEWGACGIAILVATRLTGIQFVQRSVKGAGVDYWLGDDTDDHGLFQRKARLEVSGILDGGETQIRSRLKRKLAQTTPSDSTSLPAYIAIVARSGLWPQRLLRTAQLHSLTSSQARHQEICSLLHTFLDPVLTAVYRVRSCGFKELQCFGVK